MPMGQLSRILYRAIDDQAILGGFCLPPSFDSRMNLGLGGLQRVMSRGLWKSDRFLFLKAGHIEIYLEIFQPFTVGV